jgi:hypothetical protein
VLAVLQFTGKQVPDDLAIEPGILVAMETQDSISWRKESTLTRAGIAEHILNEFVQLLIVKQPASQGQTKSVLSFLEHVVREKIPHGLYEDKGRGLLPPSIPSSKAESIASE